MDYLLPKNTSWKKFLIEEIQRDLDIPNDSIKDFSDLSLVGLPSGHLKDQQLAFSLDALIEPYEILQGSIGEQSKLILSHLQNQNMTTINGNLHVFSLSKDLGVITTGRAELLKEKLKKDIKKSEISVERSSHTEKILKVLIKPDRSLLVSCINAEDHPSFSQLLSPFPGGFTTVKDDLQAPSRAFKKLIEAQWVLGKKINEHDHILDLGACPGGWSYVALKNNASVTAIDRTPVREDLLDHPDLQFIKGDAFQFEAQSEYTWVVSDIICAPPRIEELLENWATTEKCDAFVFTIKFKGSEDYSILSEFKKKLKILPYQSLLRQLNVNKNEVMILGKKH